MTDGNRRSLRTLVILGHDGTMAAVSFIISLALRLGMDPLEYSPELVVTGTVLFTVVAMGVVLGLRLHRGVWRYASLPEVNQILRVASLTVLLFVLLLFFVTRLDAMPRSALLINWFVLVALLAGPRLAYRALKGGGVRGVLARADPNRVPVLLVGAGDRAELFLRALAGDAAASYEVVGLVGTSPGRVGRQIQGVDVMGTVDDLDPVMMRLTRRGTRPRRIIVADDGFTGAPMRELLERADGFGVTLARLPRLTDFREGESDHAEPRAVAVEDLLGRAQQVLDRDGMKRLVEGRRVLVTGAGGTIGGELARQVAALNPKHLILLDNSEFALYQIDLEIAACAPDLARDAVLGNVRDRACMSAEIARTAPELVFHAAALKHVPMVENHPEEGVLTNVVGTRNVADACRAAGVGAMVLISTDKAVNPASVMGATKRLGESYCQALNLDTAAASTRFITVRFGNVLGSTGSVVPLFQRQLATGGPLTVTDPKMTRYFMTVREAVELVLEATVLGTTSDAGDAIYVLDMGEPVKIIDLARQMIRLAGLEPERDIAIKITGLRPGEKLTEQLFHAGEGTEPTRYSGVLIARPRAPERARLVDGFEVLARTAWARNRAEMLDALAELVPEYSPPAEAPPARRAAGP